MDNIQLATLDGEDATVENIGETIADDAAPRPSAPLPATPEPAASLNISRPGPSYFIVRKGQMQGPMPFSRISERAANGDLALDYRVQDRTNGLEHPVSSIPVLRRLLETVEERRELLRFSQQRAAPRTGHAPKPPPTPPKDRRAMVTLLWVITVLGAFGGASWWLMQR